MNFQRLILFTLIVCFMGAAGTANAYDPNKTEVTGHELPKEFEGVGVEEHLGQQLDMSLPFFDDNGEKVTLGHFFNTGKPVLLAMVYYTCPSLCNLHLNGLTETLRDLKWTAGQDFDIVAVSMHPEERADVAAPKKENYVKAYGRVQSVNGWHFLTGENSSIQALAKQLGFKFKWVEEQQQFSHTSVAYAVTPGGQISRYLYGIKPDVQTVKLSLLEASKGKIGSFVEQVLLYCFHFDPKKNKYTIYAWNIMRMGAILTLLILSIILIPVWFRGKFNRSTALKGDV